MKNILRSVAIGLAVLLVLLYVGDWLRFEYERAHGTAFATVQVNRYDAVSEKGGKVEYFSEGVEMVPCAIALFPHAGDAACWWVRRYANKQTDI